MKTKFDNVRAEIIEEVRALFNAKQFDVLQTGSQELCLPVVGEEGEEGYLVLTFKVPQGSRDGDAYDGYAVAEEYRMKVEKNKAKAQASAEKKAQKIARDQKMREQRAEAKAKRTAE